MPDNNKADKIFWILKGLIIIAVISPLFVSSSLLFPYSAPKAFAFRIIVEIMAVFYLYLILVSPKFRPKKSALNYGILALFLILIFSTIVSTDRYLSFWGNLERLGGLFGLAHYFIFFFIVANVLRQEKDWQLIFKISIGVGGLIAFLAILQRFTSLGSIMAQNSRPFATLGNAAYLAGYLIFNIFLSAYVFLIQKNRLFFKVLAVFSGLAGLIGIFFTGTRGAMLGLLVGLLISLFLFGIFSSSTKVKRCCLTAVLLIIVLFGAFYFLRNTSFIKDNAALNRLTQISFSEGTVKARLLVWQLSWQALLARPVFGWGPEAYEIAFNKFYDPRLYNFELWYDRAHNFIFDWGVTSGFFGLAGYLSLIFVAFLYLWRFFKNKREHLAVLAIFAGMLITYLIQNLFAFDSPSTYLMFFLVLAHFDFKHQEPNDETSRDLNYFPSLSFGKKIILFLFAVLILIFIYRLNIQVISASHKATSLINSFGSSPVQSDKVLADFKEVFSYKNFSQGDASYQVITAFGQSLNQGLVIDEATVKEIFDLSVSQLKELITQEPNQMRYWQLSGIIYLTQSNYQPEKAELAIDSLEMAKKLAPKKQDLYFQLAGAYEQAGQVSKAKKELEELIKIDPSFKKEVENLLTEFR